MKPGFKRPKPTLGRLNRGFTVYEMLVVTAIVMVLIAVLMPTLNGVKRKAERIKCAVNLVHLHHGFMLFYADNHFFPLGTTDGYTPWAKYSPTRQSAANTDWQIEIAPYIGDGRVQVGDQNLIAGGYPEYGDPLTFAGRLPVPYRCPAYNRILSNKEYEWKHSNGNIVYMDHYGYSYNNFVMTNQRVLQNSKPIAHQGRDPRLIHTGYSGPNSASHTLYLHCSRWGNEYVRKFAANCDRSGTRYEGWTKPYFLPGSGSTAPHGEGIYAGVAAGVHDGLDNFMFLDGHLEVLKPRDAKDRRRMNKAWWRPMPDDCSFGNYGGSLIGGGEWRAWTAHCFDDDGYGIGTRREDGIWMGVAPPANYDWNY